MDIISMGNLLNKYGEIKRFTIDDLTYIVETVKMEGFGVRDEAFVPLICFYISKKTSKKKRGKLSKEDLHYKMLNTGNMKTIYILIDIIKKYLDTIKPKYIAFYPYWDYEKKRAELYLKILGRMGYQFINKEEYTYFLERE